MLGKRKNRSKASKDSLPSPDEKKSKDEGKAHSTTSHISDFKLENQKLQQYVNGKYIAPGEPIG